MTDISEKVPLVPLLIVEGYEGHEAHEGCEEVSVALLSRAQPETFPACQRRMWGAPATGIFCISY
jgi:hypothetical protein